MRILHVLDHSLPLHSGYAFRTVSLLREQRALGYETLQLTTPRQNSADSLEEEVDGWQFHRTPMPANASRLPTIRYLQEMRATARRIDDLVERHSPDVLHAHSPVLNVLPALWVGRRRRIPVVYEVRALWEDAAVDHGTTRQDGFRYRASRAIETWALRRVRRVITICEGLRGEISRRGVPPDRITVVPNAVDINVFSFVPRPDPELRKSLGLDGKRVVGFAGSFYGYEGLDLLIDALARLAPANPNLCGLLVGGGPQESALRAQVAARGLEGRVIFTGRVPQADVQRYYELIDVLAFPRRRIRLTELVTPLKPLEAMAQGRVFIASDVGGHRELVRHGETGFLCRSDDATALAQMIQTLLDNPSSWAPIALAGRRFVESERTWARSARAYRDVYAGLAVRKHELSSAGAVH